MYGEGNPASPKSLQTMDVKEESKVDGPVPGENEGGDDSVAPPTEVIAPTAAEGGGDLRDGAIHEHEQADGHLHQMGPEQLSALRPIRIKIQSLTQWFSNKYWEKMTKHSARICFRMAQGLLHASSWSYGVGSVVSWLNDLNMTPFFLKGTVCSFQKSSLRPESPDYEHYEETFLDDDDSDSSCVIGSIGSIWGDTPLPVPTPSPEMPNNQLGLPGAPELPPLPVTWLQNPKSCYLRLDAIVKLQPIIFT